MNSASPIKNNYYNDIPICNEFSNKEIRDKPIYTNEYELNKNINLRINDNNSVYFVAQNPTIPSTSLYLESDQSFSGYYHKNPMTLSYESPIVNIKDSKIYNYINSDLDPSLGIENFKVENNTRIKMPNEKQIFIILFIFVCCLIFFLK